MRIVLVNWASFEQGAAQGGGVNGYCHALGARFASMGHDVTAVSSGRTYAPDRPGVEPGAVRAVRHPDVQLPGGARVRCLEIVNSPVLAPAFAQFRDPLPEIASPELEREFSRVLRLLRPDVVHFHNIEGLSVGCVDAARAIERCVVVFSLHNHHTLCQQVYLMHQHIHPCLDYDQGRRCQGCIEAGEPESIRRERTRQFLREHGVPESPVVEHRGVLARALGRGRPAPPPSVGADVGSPDDLAPTTPTTPVRAPDVHEWQAPTQPLENRPLPVGAPAAREGEAPSARRRRAMVSMLSRCDRVLAVSQFVRDLHASMGVRADRLAVMPIGTRMVELVAGLPAACARKASDPIRLCFLGYHNYPKGLHVLVEALEACEAGVASRIDLGVHARDVAPIRARLRRLGSRLARVVVEGEYAYEEVPSLLRGVDVGVVPSVWWDNAPQTVMEFLACGVPVLGARIGGIPDMVTHGVNGLLFRANDRADLVAQLSRLVREEPLVEALRRGVRAPKGLEAHAGEMIDCYRALADERCDAQG